MCKFTTRPERGNNAQKSPMRFMGLGKMLALMLVFFAGMNLSAVAQVAQNAMPAQSVKTCSIAKGGNNISLTVKGNMPQTAKVTATQVQRTAPNGKQALGAYDITITKGNNEWQPQAGQPVMVTIADDSFVDGKVMDVYHENGPVLEYVATVSPNNGKITFPAKSFSVYIVAESEVTKRLKVNFQQADGTVVSLYVKKRDLEDDTLYKAIVYDPGVGNLPENIQFRGWTKTLNYDESTPNWTIDDVRNDIKAILNAGVTDGQEVTYYSILYRSYQISYIDEDDLVYGLHDVNARADSGEALQYTISETYEPKSTEFIFVGWNVKDGGNKIEGYTPGTVYTNGTTITITGDVEFSANAPQGHWLIFKSNGAGATYVNSQFIAANNTTQEPDAPTRYGYVFGGWYTDEECTTQFTFGGQISANTTVYAKWTEESSANYTIIVWKQNLAANGYDYATHVTLSGTPSTTITSVIENGTGDNRVALVNGTAYSFPGFHLDHFDQNVIIKPQGTAVLNVYYNRNTVTFTFMTQEGGIWGGDWSVYQTMTGLYGQTLAQNGYTWPNAYWWRDGQNGGTRTTFLEAFILSDDASSQTFYGYNGNAAKEVHFYKQNASGTDYVLDMEVEAQNGTFYISDKYSGFKAVQYRVGNGNWQNLPSEKDANGYYGSVSQYSSGNIEVRYNRINYSILYADGVYEDADGNALGEENRGELMIVENVRFGQELSSYNVGNENYFVPEFEGYTFAGWYADPLCSNPYTFSDMPDGGITVYAKWVRTQYRIYLHANAGDKTSSPTLTWNGGTDQQMSFRVDYEGQVQTPVGSRQGYHFIGWFTDEACTLPFNPDAFDLNEITVTEDYDWDVDMTDSIDIWSNFVGTPYNKDKNNNRFWITKKYNLYAKWNLALEGAEGINLVYDCGGGDPCPIDGKTYIEGVQALADAAPGTAPVAENGKQQRFAYWVVQKFNETSGKFEDSDVAVFPGAEFTVNAADAKKTPITEDKNQYTVQLRAEYVMAEEPTPTHITWFRNDGTTGDAAVHQDYSNISINDAVEIPAAPVRQGYEFLGWYKYRVVENADVPTNLPEDATNPDTPNFLFYNAEDQKYYKNSTFTAENIAEYVAADEANPYDYLYAVWEQTCAIPEVTVQEVAVCKGETATLQATVTNPQEGVTYTYQWYNAYPVEPVAITGATSETLSSDTTGFYGVIVSAGENCESEMATANVTVNPMAEVTIEGAGEICAGEEATLTATLSEEANNVTYQWYIVNADLTETEIDGATDATYKTTQFGTYKVIVTYNTVCTAWATATLTPNSDAVPEIEISKKEQTIVYGNEIDDVTVTSNTEITFEPTPVPEGFALEDGVLTSNLPEVGTYNFYVTAENPCGKKSDTIKVIVTPKTLTITGNFAKPYDGDYFVVNATDLTYNGLVGDDEITEGTVTSEDYVYGTYKCTDGQFLRTMEDMAAIQANFGPAEVTKNYTPSFNVTLNIDKKAITVTAASDEKVYDGEPLVNGEYTIDELAEGDEATVTVEGSITCVGEADNTPVVSAIVRTVDENRDVMDSYEITLVKGKLVVTPVENALECATEETVIEMKDCELTKVVTVEDLTSTPTVTGIDEAHYTLVNNLDELNPMSEGVYEIVWTLTDDCGNAMATCTQSVKLQYGACEGINGYEAVRIGSQCWMKENLKDEVGTYKAYKEDDANLEKFGYLYTWYTAMGLEEGDDSTDPWANAPTDACGNPYVQGICPEGWAVGSDADYALLGATAGDASFLKDPSTEYWLPEKAGVVEGNLGFNARGGGWYNSTLGDFEDIYAAFRYWTPDSEPGAYATSGSINYFCGTPQTLTNKKSDMMSVRCIRKVQPNE